MEQTHRELIFLLNPDKLRYKNLQMTSKTKWDRVIRLFRGSEEMK